MNAIHSRGKIPIWSVADLSSAIAGTLIKTFGYIAVKGEISNFSRSPNGHCYFSIKDGGGVLKAICFAGIARNLNVNLCDGLEIVVYGNIDSRADQSQYQIKVQSIKFAGLGEIMAILEERKHRLALEGLFDPKHKKDIPKFPRKIGILTSPHGAVIHDITAILQDRFPVEILLYGIQVQGNSTVQQAISGIKYFNTQEPVDIIIIARGGGSVEDLLAFNDENLVRAVFASKIPVISAIGHEIDYTLCDFVADLRAPTPTAAAECIGSKKEQILQEISILCAKCANNISQKIITSQYFVTQIFGKLTVFTDEIQVLGQKIRDAQNAILHRITLVYTRLDYAAKTLQSTHNTIGNICKNNFVNKQKWILLIGRNLEININNLVAYNAQKIAIIPISAERIQYNIAENINKYMQKIHTRAINITNQLTVAGQNIAYQHRKNTINIEHLVSKYSNLIAVIQPKINAQITSKMENCAHQLAQILNKLERSDHVKILAHGYAILSDKNGKAITKIAEIQNNMLVKIQMQDGVRQFFVKLPSAKIAILTLVFLGAILANFTL